MCVFENVVTSFIRFLLIVTSMYIYSSHLSLILDIVTFIFIYCILCKSNKELWNFAIMIKYTSAYNTVSITSGSQRFKLWKNRRHFNLDYLNHILDNCQHVVLFRTIQMCKKLPTVFPMKNRSIQKYDILLHAKISVFVNNTCVAVNFTAPPEFAVARAGDFDRSFLHTIAAPSTQIPATFSLRTTYLSRLVATRALSIQCSTNSISFICFTMIRRPFYVHQTTSGKNRKHASPPRIIFVFQFLVKVESQSIRISPFEVSSNLSKFW